MCQVLKILKYTAQTCTLCKLNQQAYVASITYTLPRSNGSWRELLTHPFCFVCVPGSPFTICLHQICTVSWQSVVRQRATCWPDWRCAQIFELGRGPTVMIVPPPPLYPCNPLDITVLRKQHWLDNRGMPTGWYWCMRHFGDAKGPLGVSGLRFQLLKHDL